MPQRPLKPGLLWVALAAQLALLLLLLSARQGLGPTLYAALVIICLLIVLTATQLWQLGRRTDASGAPPLATGDAQARTRFLTQLSHEIRTPMNAVMGMTQLALQTPLSAEQRELLNKADAASRALLGLIVDALDVARLEDGQTRLAEQPLRLEDVVAQAIEQVRPLHTNPGVALVCDWADASLLGLRGELLGDAQRLQQVLVNLLAHAIRFTSSGQVLLRVAAHPSDATGRVPLCITVQDSGPGMTPEQLDSLISDTPPAETPGSLRFAGAGLGLTTARRLAELMGGRLDAQSQPGRGSSFEVRLALLPNPQGLPATPLPPLRLLLAKAATDSREAALALLDHLGLGAGRAASATAASTLAAVAEAREAGRPFDWLLLDWLLPGPGPTGADLLAQLRREHPGLRIAVLTPPGPDAEPAQARAFGARALCPEPLLPADLRRLLADSPADVPGDRPAGVDAQLLAGLRVLLVEDHPINQEIAVRMLSSRGATVTVAGNGQEGLDRLQAEGPAAYDLVLMDLQMPVLDGLSATRRLRELPAFDALPVLAMTAHALPEEKAQCLAAGMQGHIAKPLNVGRLVREVKRYLPAPPPEAERAPLDLQLGLRQFDGQTALYRRTLQGFADQYADGLAPWPAWLAEGAWLDLRRAAHTLQGLAATLGAQPLHAAALALERSAMLADAHGAAAHLGRTQSALQRVLDDIAQALARPAESTPAADAGPGQLAELRELLAQNDSRALDWWQAHGAHSGLDGERRHAIDAALAALDFDAAAAALGPPAEGGA